MAAREGKEATGQLLQNIQDQLNRLITQLADLEEMKADLDEDEYTSTKTETLQQLKEFEKSLQKTLAGNLSLVDSLSAVRLAIQGAISNAFKTPEVIRMFANKQPAQLRFKLAALQREHKLKTVDKLSFTSQVMQIMCLPVFDALFNHDSPVRLWKFWLHSSVSVKISQLRSRCLWPSHAYDT